MAIVSTGGIAFDETGVIDDAFRDAYQAIDRDCHRYTLSEYTAIMRGESGLTHLPDGRCKECRLLFEKQVELLKRKGHWKMHYRQTWVSTVEMVRAGLQALCEQANG